ncbi:helix-turn-helix domain-containing protein [Corynebacterium macclintockiae]|uniref:TetR/AcrR family transcriptional regulator n=1 Tax=Corynebacterium macclintockiae TaxID=2913501 RepID=UPI00254F0E0A|nr:TetR/AcrR family transcriptional regulator [Corynebacterium macclintockiae]MDK8889912.1 helix-turn-helix domain-containing protein [Corynebacterium macclintockiae]
MSTAVDILQQYGLADLTMRRLARALDVAPGALYWHFPNKQALLGGIAESILTAVPARPGSAVDYCSFLFDALTSLRDGAEITLAAVASDTLDRDLAAELGAELDTELNAGAVNDEVDGAVDGAVDVAEAASKLLLRFVFGSALELQARQGVALSLSTAEEDAGSSQALAREDLVLGVETILRGFSR